VTGGGHFVLYGDQSNGTAFRIVSEDGMTWHNGVTGGSRFQSIAYGNGMFLRNLESRLHEQRRAGQVSAQRHLRHVAPVALLRHSDGKSPAMTTSFSRASTLVTFSAIVACTYSTKPTALDPLPGGAFADLEIREPTIESVTRPHGLGTKQPRFGWKLVSPRRGEIQTGYQILVASTPERLARDEGDLWDSGRVTSERQAWVTYQGKPLVSRQSAHWKVRVWDGAQRASRWSTREFWDMAIFDGEWQARWIASPATEVVGTQPMDLSSALWIWYPDSGDAFVPAGKRHLRRSFLLPADRRIVSARLLAGVNDRARIVVNAETVAQLVLNRSPPVVDVARYLRPGQNVIATEVENEGGPGGFIARLEITFDRGPPTVLQTDAKWRAETVDGATVERKDWIGATFDDRAWKPARIIAGFRQPPLQSLPPLMTTPPPAPYFRRTFTLDGEIEDARLHLAGLGYHEAQLNGQRVGDHVLDPSFTDYTRRVEVVVHDVTSLLRRGENAIGVVLGNGLYHQHDQDAWDFHAAAWRDKPMLRAELHVRLRDGKSFTLVSDESWRVGTGPIRYDGTRHGETYDARLAEPSGFVPVVLVPGPRGKLVAQEHPPIRVTETRKAAAVREVKTGVFVVDTGQNLTGWLRLRVRGKAGDKITLRYAEKVHPDGTLDSSNIDTLVRSPRFQTDVYFLAGDGEESWEPRFVYHGFQYVEITGWPGTPTVHDFDVRVVHTDFRSAGSFVSSNDLLNRLQEATRWSYRGNFHSIPTDCPHREKNGWTGDAHLALQTGLFNFDSAANYRKWVADMLDAQTKRGDLPGIVPSAGWGLDQMSGPAWEAAFFEIPWGLYLFHGDERVLQDVFPGWLRYLAYAEARAENGVAKFGLGDWVPLQTVTPAALTSTAFVHRVAVIAERTARLLGKVAEAKRLDDLAKRLQRAFAAEFVDAASGQVANDQQTALAVSLQHDLIAGPLRDKTARRLHDSVERDGFHLDTGVLGAKLVPRALAEAGYLEASYKILSADKFPSWGYWITQGANTLWEDWKGASSRNHIFFGDISAWFFEYLAGIRPVPEAPGFARVLLAPYVPPNLEFVRASHESPRGPIESAWKKEADGVRFSFAIPPNSRALVVLPARDAGLITEQGISISEIPGVKVQDASPPGKVSFAIGSGRYEFLVRN
jgi:alpha-L-rhamnosidase